MIQQPPDAQGMDGAPGASGPNSGDGQGGGGGGFMAAGVTCNPPSGLRWMWRSWWRFSNSYCSCKLWTN